MGTVQDEFDKKFMQLNKLMKSVEEKVEDSVEEHFEEISLDRTEEERRRKSSGT